MSLLSTYINPNLDGLATTASVAAAQAAIDGLVDADKQAVIDAIAGLSSANLATLLAAIARATPEVIDALPDAQGNPPAGYAWVADGVAFKNYAYSADDNVQTISAYTGPGVGTTPVACSECLAFLQTSAGTFAVQTEIGQFAVSLAAGLTLQAFLGAKLLASDQDAGTATMLVVYTTADSLNARTLQSAVIDLTGAVTLPGSLALTTEVIEPQAIALASGSYLLRVASNSAGTPAWLAIDATTGNPSVLQGDSSIGSYTGRILGAAADVVLLASKIDTFIRVRKLVIDATSGTPLVKATVRNIVVSLPGMTASATPGAVAVTAAGTFSICTRAGFFEAALASDDTVTVKQVAGIHPLIALESGSDTTQLDIVAAVYSLLQGNPTNFLLATSQRVYSVDYTTLQSLFVRKARLAS